MKKYLILALAAFGFFMSFAGIQGGAEEDQSIGTTAGQTARDITDQTQKTVATASVQTEQATKQFAQVADETFQKLSIQFQEAMKNLQQSSQELMKRFNEEEEKFKQAYDKPAKP